jgi:hypothetical protein
MSTETPLKPTRNYAEQFAKIEITAEQRKEAHARALEILRGCAPATEILHEHPSGTPEWEPVCEPVPLPKRKWESLFEWTKNPEPIVWRECERVVMPPAVPQSAEDVVEVYLAPRQPTMLPEKPSIITKLTYGDLW